MMNHRVVSREEWREARVRLLSEEKELTRRRDELARRRRELPWVRVDSAYAFSGPRGEETLGSLFAGRSQLVVYHLMFAPEWDAACKHCSFWADHFDGVIPHIKARDATLVAISRAPYAKLAAYASRMGWSFDWFSSFGTTFNYDFGVSFAKETLDAKQAIYNYAPSTIAGSDMPGISVFAKDDAGEVFHTYSCFTRGIEGVNATYQFLDLVPKGRDEDDLPYTMAWVRRHDEYESAPTAR
jgi:predicted dithiol-disulfide oxidoreductase (DUF899 family)